MRRSWWGIGLAAAAVGFLMLALAQRPVAVDFSDEVHASSANPYELLWSRLAAEATCISEVDEEPGDVAPALALPRASLDVPTDVGGLRWVDQEVLKDGTSRSYIGGYMFPIPAHLADGMATTDSALLARNMLAGVEDPYVSAVVSVGDPALLCYALAHAALQPAPGTVSAPSEGDGRAPFVDWLPPHPEPGALPAGAVTEIRDRVAYFLPRRNGPGGRVNMLVWLEDDTTLVEVHGEGVTDTALRAVAEVLVVEVQSAVGP